MAKALWEREELFTRELNENENEFLIACMSENLEHARHVENERLTFNSIYMAMVAGVLAFVYSLDAPKGFAIGITALMIVLGLLAIMLTMRWDQTFDQHIEYAKHCYRVLHIRNFPEFNDKYDPVEVDPNEAIEGLQDQPAYCFRPKTHKIIKLRTRVLFMVFYLLIEAVLVITLIYFITQ